MSIKSEEIVKQGYSECFTILKKRYEQVDGERVRSIRIKLLNNKMEMVLNFEEEKPKSVDEDIRNRLLPLVRNRKKIYTNQILHGIRFDLLTEKNIYRFF